MECRTALVQHQGNFEKALETLKTNSINKGTEEKPAHRQPGIRNDLPSQPAVESAQWSN